MIPKRKNGFVMIVMILMLSLVGTALFVLSASARTMTKNWRYMQVNADCDNIIASVKQWTKLNTDKLTDLEQGKGIAIDIKEIITTKATCQLSVVQRSDTEMTLNIAIDYSHAQLNGQKNIEFILTDLKPIDPTSDRDAL